VPVTVPGRRPAFKPLNRLRGGPFKSGRKGLMLSLNLTAMVDMFTVIVIFLLQNFSASGEILFMQKNLKLPTAEQAEFMAERGPVVTLFENRVLWEGKEIARLTDLDEAEQDIPALTENLQGVRQREEQLWGKSHTGMYEGHGVVQADRATDFKLVRRAVFSFNLAGWVHINFATMGEAQAAEEAAKEGAGEH
jgi:biopolymer transport protein ExbD